MRLHYDDWRDLALTLFYAVACAAAGGVLGYQVRAWEHDKPSNTRAHTGPVVRVRAPLKPAPLVVPDDPFTWSPTEPHLHLANELGECTLVGCETILGTPARPVRIWSPSSRVTCICDQTDCPGMHPSCPCDSPKCDEDHGEHIRGE